MAKKQRLIGFRRFTSKKNTPVCIATVATECDQTDNERGRFGCMSEEIFMPSELYSYLQADDIGCEVTAEYSVVNGRAYLNDFIVHRKGAGPQKEAAAGK